MADKAIANISASIFHDEIRSSMGGVVEFDRADSDDKWIFSEVAVSNSSSNLITVRDFLGTGDTTTTSDKERWLAVKVISPVKTNGVCICFGNETAIFSLANGLFIGSGEMLVVKCPNTTIGNLNAISVAMDGTYGYPSGTTSVSVTCHIAAIIEDVA